MKVCKVCGETKPLDDFPRHPSTTDGHLIRCKVCHNIIRRARYKANPQRGRNAARKWRLKNPKQYKENQARWRTENRDKVHDYDRQYREANQEKRQAKQLAFRAVERGDLIRPDSCSECGKECVPHGHHDDYSRPLEVRWLCHACHLGWHRENRMHLRYI